MLLYRIPNTLPGCSYLKRQMNARETFIRHGYSIYTTKIGTFVCPHISETVAVRIIIHETRTSSTYCLDNEQTHFKTFTVHFINYILNN